MEPGKLSPFWDTARCVRLGLRLKAVKRRLIRKNAIIFGIAFRLLQGELGATLGRLCISHVKAIKITGSRKPRARLYQEYIYIPFLWLEKIFAVFKQKFTLL